jgi:hypothetical protein
MNKLSKNKLSKYAFILTLLIISWILFEVIVKGSSIVQGQYGINPATFLKILIIAEIFFDLGIVIIIIGSGIIKFKLQEIFNFNLERVNFKNNLVYFGFSINRIAASIPPLYLLLNGWKKFPFYITILLLVEMFIVLYITSLPIERKKKWKK